MCSTKCTAIYSLTGIIFLVFVYTLLSTQPFFITGINDINVAKTSALGALGAFVGMFILSIVGICRSSRHVLSSEIDRGSYNRLNVNLDYQMSESLS